MSYRQAVLHEAVRMYRVINKRDVSKFELKWLFSEVAKMPDKKMYTQSEPQLVKKLLDNVLVKIS